MKHGARLYHDSSTATAFKKIAEATFDFTLETPSYEFGDRFEVTDEPSSKDAFTEYQRFAMTDLVAGEEGTGFLKTTGGFRIIPNFAIMNWQFQFALEMPSIYFTNGNWVYFHA